MAQKRLVKTSDVEVKDSGRIVSRELRHLRKHVEMHLISDIHTYKLEIMKHLSKSFEILYLTTLE